MDESRIKLMEKSRQVGLTWASAYRAVRKALGSKGIAIWVSSTDAVQAKLFLQDCKVFVKLYNVVYDEVVGGSIESGGGIFSIKFGNGSSINCLSSNPDAQAGKRGTRILDEFALHDDSEFLYNVAYPGITWGGNLEIISTHRGANNFFNKLINEARHGGNPKKISLHRVTLVDALEQGFLNRLKAKLPADDPRQEMDDGDYFNFIKSSCASEAIFQQEYMCTPAEDNQSFLDTVNVKNCMYETGSYEEKWPSGRAFLGVDIAREHDYSVFCLIEPIEDVLYTRKMICLKKASFDEQERILGKIFDSCHVVYTCIDQTGIGRQFVERAQSKFGKMRVIGVNFTQQVKEDLAFSLKNVVDKQKIRIPNDETLLTDMTSITSSFTSKYASFSAKHSSIGHADRFWALALAIHACKYKIKTAPNVELYKAPKQRY